MGDSRGCAVDNTHVAFDFREDVQKDKMSSVENNAPGSLNKSHEQRNMAVPRTRSIFFF